MTPDAFDETPEDDDENGVLPDTVSIDSTALGVLSGQTAQVSVILPSPTDDDALDDEDVVDDEMPQAIEASDSPEGGAVDAAGTASPVSEPVAIEPPAETAEAEIVEDDAHPAHIDDDAHAGDADHVDADIVEDIPEPAAALVGPAEGSTPATPPDPAPATAAPTTRTGSVPATRWELQHPDQPQRPQRARSAERVTTRNEVALSSKRLGEFEGGRETPDLLTPDRLLDQRHLVRAEPEGVWRHLVYSLTGRRVNLGDSRRARARKELDRRIGAPLTGGARFVPVLSRKGGVGKTTVTTLLGMALADARDDRVIAVDANPDRGTLAERIARANGKTVRDLARARAEVNGYNDISRIVARDATRLDVLASDADPRVSEAFSDRDYHDVATLAAHYYSIVLTDTGTGIVHSVMGATLELADQLVVVAGLSVDEARLASETLTWLETNGYAEHVKNAVVVLNNSRPGPPVVRPDELETHFRSRVRAVIRLPFDPQIAAGSAITFRDLQPATRLAARELAATVVEGLRDLAPAA
ncbi:MinD-like ATPase involved in chromosome partitioning or flagellar assembly [Microbacterium sp. AK009]|uniref:MinD/ParA family ATP-binding protein n=1 Tax=Microbacterium sp. AK009 TaxID=2723068 RepID=UPI0015CCCA9C|nr:MinD/ParA family protein [Microbacterium sp. AK009]NYF16338.1 MinD-like ATPase involved in chromosome partitioning or flagellar assembly [Microbacterium sp. AK009]